MAGNWAEEGVIDLIVNDGVYFNNQKGLVCNLDGHIIKPAPSKAGLRVELRRNGQREKILVLDLLTNVGYNTCGGDTNEAG